jgi:CBS domain containing-hemolysin-like protein
MHLPPAHVCHPSRGRIAGVVTAEDIMKELVVDLDGTLAPSKSSIDAEMATLLDKLVRLIKGAVISGGN